MKNPFKKIADKPLKRAEAYWAKLGPGLTTGAADDDPSITIKNGVPYQWLLASGVTNPFAANVTTLYVSTTAGCTLYLLFQVSKSGRTCR
jgi:hypothetical protein